MQSRSKHNSSGTAKKEWKRGKKNKNKLREAQPRGKIFEILQFLFLRPVFLCILTCTIHIIVSD